MNKVIKISAIFVLSLSLSFIAHSSNLEDHEGYHSQQGAGEYPAQQQMDFRVDRNGIMRRDALFNPKIGAGGPPPPDSLIGNINGDQVRDHGHYARRVNTRDPVQCISLSQFLNTKKALAERIYIYPFTSLDELPKLTPNEDKSKHPIMRTPIGVLKLIFNQLPTGDYINLSKVCQGLYSLCYREDMLLTRLSHTVMFINRLIDEKSIHGKITGRSMIGLSNASTIILNELKFHHFASTLSARNDFPDPSKLNGLPMTSGHIFDVFDGCLEKRNYEFRRLLNEVSLKPHTAWGMAGALILKIKLNVEAITPEECPLFFDRELFPKCSTVKQIEEVLKDKLGIVLLFFSCGYEWGGIKSNAGLIRLYNEKLEKYNEFGKAHTFIPVKKFVESLSLTPIEFGDFTFVPIPKTFLIKDDV